MQYGANQSDTGPSKATGWFDYTSKGLGPNDYFLRDMTAATGSDPNASYVLGNGALGAVLPGFNDLPVTLTPNGDKTQFTFTCSTDQLANGFFGGFGVYVKQ